MRCSAHVSSRCSRRSSRRPPSAAARSSASIAHPSAFISPTVPTASCVLTTLRAPSPDPSVRQGGVSTVTREIRFLRTHYDSCGRTSESRIPTSDAAVHLAHSAERSGLGTLDAPGGLGKRAAVRGDAEERV